MNINFKGYQNTGSMVVNKIKSKEVINHCFFTSLTDIGRQDYRESQKFLDTFTSRKNAIFISVDSMNIPLKESTIKVNNTCLKYKDENLGKISMVAKFLKKVMESDDKLFGIDMNKVHQITQSIQNDPKAPTPVKKISGFKMYNHQKAKNVAKEMFLDIQDKVLEHLKTD